MLIFESDLLNALDFLFIVSGAPIESIENKLLKNQQFGRARSLELLKRESNLRHGFFFPFREERFLEVLFLKLSFLDQIVRRIFPNLETHQHPDLGLSLDRIWVELPDTCNTIPRLWNFKVRMIQDDLDTDSLQVPDFPKSPPAYGYYFLGLVWFFTLGVNRRQGSMTVYSAVKQAVSPDEPEGNASDDLFNRAFSPENIFWNSDAIRVPEAWSGWWTESIRMGLSLFREGMKPSGALSHQDFVRRMDHLRGEIRRSLFEKSAAPGSEAREPDGNRAIRDMLLKIKDGISGNAGWTSPMKDSAGENGIEAPEMEETVILSRNAVQAESPPEEIIPDDDLVETVILGRDRNRVGDSAALNPIGTSRKTGAEEDDPMETVVLSGRKRTTVIEDIPQTIILSSRKVRRAASDPERRTPMTKSSDPPPADVPENDDDLMSRTIILRPGGTGEEE